MAIRSFKDKLTESVNYGETSKQTQKLLPAELHKKAQTKLAVLGAATSLQDLMELRGNRFEALKGDRAGQFSIRINVSIPDLLRNGAETTPSKLR